MHPGKLIVYSEQSSGLLESVRLLESFQNATRKQAVAAAKEKAATMAGAVGAVIAEPIYIEEDVSIEQTLEFDFQ
jgi:uncharacterized protein YggE